MKSTLLLASSSQIRRELLEAAGLVVTTEAPRIDEESIRAALQAEDTTAREVADALAEAKARKLAIRHPDALVLGCDQVLNHAGALLSKPTSRDAAMAQLIQLRGTTHQLLSAAVLYEEGKPVWRHVGTARLTMRNFSDSYMESYLDRNWPDVSNSVGGYKLESEGVRLFSAVQGSHFTILGLPLLELLDFLSVRGTIAA